MRLGKRLEIGALTMGLALGCATHWTFGEDKPGADRPAPPAGDARPGADEGRDRNRPPFDPKMMLDRMEKHWNDTLNLSAEQKTKVKSIVDKAKTDIDAALKAGDNQEPRERFGKVREIMGPVREQLRDVLDQTQRDKLRESGEFGPPPQGGPDGVGKPGRPGKGGDGDGDRPHRPFRGGGGPDGPGPRGFGGPGGPGGPGGGPPPHRDPGEMVHRLKDSLSKLQLNDDQKKKIDALLSDTEKKLNDLTTEAEKAQAEMRGKFRSAMQSSHEQLESILTDEQKQKLHEMMRPPGGGDRGPRGGGGGEGRRGKGPDAPPPAPKQPKE